MTGFRDFLKLTGNLCLVCGERGTAVDLPGADWFGIVAALTRRQDQAQHDNEKEFYEVGKSSHWDGNVDRVVFSSERPWCGRRLLRYFMNSENLSNKGKLFPAVSRLLGGEGLALHQSMNKFAN